MIFRNLTNRVFSFSRMTSSGVNSRGLRCVSSAAYREKRTASCSFLVHFQLDTIDGVVAQHYSVLNI